VNQGLKQISKGGKQMSHYFICDPHLLFPHVKDPIHHSTASVILSKSIGYFSGPWKTSSRALASRHHCPQR
jgi:hypothetical protein